MEQGKGTGESPRDGSSLIVVRDLEIVVGTKEPFTLKVPSLDIPRGLFTTILGQSGCGKTTLLMTLGLMRGFEDEGFSITCNELSFHLGTPLPGATELDYYVYGGKGHEGEPSMTRIERETLRRSLIGFCLQGGELIPSLPLIDNVAIPRLLGGLSEPDRHSRDRLKQLGLDSETGSKIGNLPGELSGGQRQRGVFARALIHDPPLVMLDEPTSDLDRKTAEQAITALRKQTRRLGQTVIMVTHDETLARDFSDCIIKMDDVAPRVGSVTHVDRNQPREDIHDQLPESDSGIEPVPPDASEAEPASIPPVREVGSEPASPVAPRGRLNEVLEHARLGVKDALGPLYGFFENPIAFIRDKKHSRDPSFLLRTCRSALVIVAIGLLMLLLRGMRSGLVEDFKRDLTKSPTARELTITPLASTGSLTGEALSEIAASHPEIEMVIPSVTHVVFPERYEDRELSITLTGTLPTDPKLLMVYADQDFTGFDSNSIVLPASLAEELEVEVGSDATVWVSRFVDEEGVEKEYQPATLRVSNILGDVTARTAYIHLDLTGDIADFKAGRHVPARGWPGSPQPIDPRYEAFLLFAKNELSGREQTALRSRGLEVERLEPDDPAANLWGFLKSREETNAMGLLRPLVYRLLSGRQEGDLRWLGERIWSVEDLLTDSDAIVMPWNQPISATLDGEEVTLVGMSASSRWLRRYLRYPRGPFPKTEHDWQVTFGDRGEETQSGRLAVALDTLVLNLPVDVHGSEERDAVEPRAGPDAEPPETVVAEESGTGSPDTDGHADTAADSVVPGVTAAGLSEAEETEPDLAADGDDGPDDGVDSPSPAEDVPEEMAGVIGDSPSASAADSSVGAAAPDSPPGAETATAADTVPVEEPEPPRLAIVPAAFLAHILMTRDGIAEPDTGLGQFRSQAEERQYYKARVFVHDVYQVVGMHEKLSGRFGVRSNQARVKEVQKYRSILDFLVNVLSVIGVVIAFATVWIVFHDVSERKKGMIGTLRIMGLSRGGVMTLLLTQGILVALISGVLLVIFGLVIAGLINLIVGESACALGPVDFLWVAVAIVLVCVVGTYFPARAVSRVDPVVALKESQKR
ncbi:MAG: ATP-binding cassette domain-containing protein [Candidatus Eisenbacteria bacterium]